MTHERPPARPYPEAGILPIETEIVVVRVKPVIGTGAYASGDALGAKFGLPDVVREKGGAAILESVVVLDQDDEGVQIDFPLFARNFTATADNAAFAVTDADLEFCVGVVSVSNYANFSVNQVGTARGLGLALVIPTGRDLFCQAVVRGTPTFAATDDLTFIFTFVRA